MKKSKLFWCCLALALFAATAMADVTIHQETVVQTMRNQVAMDGVIKIQGDKSYMHTQGKEGVKAMPGMMPLDQTIITRIDKGLIWMINPVTNTYEEMTLEEMKNLTQDVPESAGEGFNWTVDIKELGQKEISGYTATGIRGVATGVSTDNANNKTRITYEIWSAKDIPGKEELMAHFEKSADVAGQDQFLKRDVLNKAYQQVGPAFEEISDRIAAMEGFPVKMNMMVQMKISGEGPAKERMEAMKQFMGEPDEEGWMTLTSHSSMVTGIETGPVDDSVFELPEGAKK